MAANGWDAGTGWKLHVLQQVLIEDPTKLNQVSSLLSQGEVLSERGTF